MTNAQIATILDSFFWARKSARLSADDCRAAYRAARDLFARTGDRHYIGVARRYLRAARAGGLPRADY